MPLAEKLRALRENRGLRQRDIALAFGVSAQLVSSWENPRSTQSPSLDRLRDYAQLFATPRSFADGRVTMLSVDELSAEEQQEFEALVAELQALRGDASGRDTIPARSIEERGRGFFSFRDQRPIVVIGSRQPDHVLASVPEADERHPDHVHALLHADADAVFELVAQLRLANPDSTVTSLLPEEVQPERDLTGHIVIVGGPTLNSYAEWFVESGFLEAAAAPVEEPPVDMDELVEKARQFRQAASRSFPSGKEAGVPGPDTSELPDLKWTGRRFRVPADLAAEAPAVTYETSDDGVRLAVYHPEFRGRVDLLGTREDGSDTVRVPNLFRDLAIIARQPNPLAPDATATLMYGLFAQGTLGAARAFGDPDVGIDNETYIAERFATEDRFWMLVWIFCDRRLRATKAPRLREPDLRVLEWPAKKA